MNRSILSLSLLTFAGCAGAGAAFLSYGSLSLLPALLYGLLSALLTGALSRVSGRRRLLFFVLSAAAGLFLLFHWREGLLNSAAVLSTSFLDTFAAPYHLDLDKPFLMDPAIGGGDAETAALLLLTWCFAAGAWHPLARLLCGALSLFLTLCGLYFAVEPPLFTVLLSAAYWASIPVMAVRKRNNTAQGAALLSVLIMGALLMIAVPPSRYKEPDLFSRVSDTIAAWTDGSWFHGGSAFSTVMTGTEGRGRLGETEGLRYTGRQIIRITSPAAEHRLYIRSWVGSLYEDNQWKLLPESRYQTVSRLFENNQGAWYNQSAWLMEIANQDPAIASAMNGYLKDPPDFASRRQFFGVPLVYEYTDQLFLPYDISFAASRLFHYDQAPVSRDGAAYEAYRWSLPLSTAYALTEEGHFDDPYWRAYVNMERDYRAFAYDAYTAVPERLRAVLAAALPIQKASTNEEKRHWIRTVQKYFSDYYTYTIRPGRTPEGEDFISYFLQTQKEGYCSAFASAGVMFLRAAGIPARYVTGVTVGVDELTQAGRTAEGYFSMDVNDRHAHAWAEIYVDGIGWRPVEFTPGYEGGEDPIPAPPENRPDSSSPDENQQNPEPNPPQQDQQPGETPQRQNPTQPPAAERPAPQPVPAGHSGSLSGILYALLALAALAGAAAWAIRRRIGKAERLLQSAASPAARSALFTYLLRLTAWAGLPAPGESYTAWAASCEKDARFEGLSQVTALLMKARYSGTPFTAEEQQNLLSLVQAIRTRCLSPLKGQEKWKFLLRSL